MAPSIQIHAISIQIKCFLAINCKELIFKDFFGLCLILLFTEDKIKFVYTCDTSVCLSSYKRIKDWLGTRYWRMWNISDTFLS